MTSHKMLNVWCLVGHTARVWQADWHPNGHLLVSCSADRTIKFWNVESSRVYNTDASNVLVNGSTEMQSVKSLEAPEHGRSIRSIAFSPSAIDSKVLLLATCSFDSKTVIWECPVEVDTKHQMQYYKNWAPAATLEGHENEVKCVAWTRYYNHSDSLYLATCGRDKSIWIWEVNEDLTTDCVAVLQEHTQDVKYIRWHTTSGMLFSASADDSIKIWKENEEEGDWFCLKTLSGHSNIVWSLDFDASGRWLVSASEDATIRIWDKEKQWQCVFVLSGVCQRAIYSVSWSKADPFSIAFAGGDDTIFIYTWHEESCRLELDTKAVHAHQGDINFVLWHPTVSNRLLSCGDDTLVHIWDIV